MTQREWMREFDAAAASTFHASGIADSARLTRKVGGAVVPCTVLVDRDALRVGDQGQMVVFPAVITAFLAEVVTVAIGDKFEILDGATVTDTFTANEPELLDESRVVFRCKKGV